MRTQRCSANSFSKIFRARIFVLNFATRGGGEPGGLRGVFVGGAEGATLRGRLQVLRRSDRMGDKSSER
jgi:hypothetical protein